MDDGFTEKLAEYKLQLHLVPALKEVVYTMLDTYIESSRQHAAALKNDLTEVCKKIDSLEERYYLNNEIPTEVYEKLKGKQDEEKAKIEESLANTHKDSSNLKNHFDGVVYFSLKLATGLVLHDLV